MLICHIPKVKVLQKNFAISTVADSSSFTNYAMKIHGLLDVTILTMSDIDQKANHTKKL